MSDPEDLRPILTRYEGQLRFLAAHPLRNRAQIRRLRTRVQAIAEAQRDILTTAVVGKIGVGQLVDKNNYPSYERQVEGAYKMYDGLADYGSELVPAVVDLRVSFISGEGVSLYSENEKKLDFLRAFIKLNHLSGSKLVAAVLMAELEGRALFVLAPNVDKKSVDARLYSWHTNKYKVTRDKKDLEKVLSIEYTPEGQDKLVSIPINTSLYVKTGGSGYKDEQSTTKVGKCLTQCENASRAAFDLRKNTHIFGKVFPYWKTASAADAKTINDGVTQRSFEIGDGYAGPAEMGLIEPSGAAADQVVKDMLCSLRFVAAMTGVPIHWLAWPELMSNRATAENMLEVVSAGTKKERLIWEESLLLLFEKVLTIAVDAGFAGAEVLEGEVDVKLPLVSLASLQQLIDVWTPIWKDELISTFTMRNMLPGIDPAREDELIAEEKERKAKDSPFVNVTADQVVAGSQQAAQQAADQAVRGVRKEIKAFRNTRPPPSSVKVTVPLTIRQGVRRHVTMHHPDGTVSEADVTEEPANGFIMDVNSQRRTSIRHADGGRSDDVTTEEVNNGE